MYYEQQQGKLEKLLYLLFSPLAATRRGYAFLQLMSPNNAVVSIGSSCSSLLLQQLLLLTQSSFTSRTHGCSLELVRPSLSPSSPCLTASGPAPCTPRSPPASRLVSSLSPHQPAVPFDPNTPWQKPLPDMPLTAPVTY